MTDVKTIDELIKEGLLKKGNDPSLIVHRIPIGIASLDELLGGGLPLGRFTSTYGEESTGKTLLAQLAVAAVQKTDRPFGLYMDLESSYDQKWWEQSGVDVDKLLVSKPATAEQAIDIMVAMIEGSKELGIVVLDSLGAMIPAPMANTEKSAEDNQQPGSQAKVITLMYSKLKVLVDQHKIIFLSINQMRDSIGMASDLAGLPGGRANRHYNHIILKTRRDGWIMEHKNRLGFNMEITSRKNKLAATPDGTAITLPFLFKSQIDWTQSYLDDGIKNGLIVRKGPSYAWAGRNHLGMQNLRNFFSENPEELELLKTQLGV